MPPPTAAIDLALQEIDVAFEPANPVEQGLHVAVLSHGVSHGQQEGDGGSGGENKRFAHVVKP